MSHQQEPEPPRLGWWTVPALVSVPHCNDHFRDPKANVPATEGVRYKALEEGERYGGHDTLAVVTLGAVSVVVAPEGYVSCLAFPGIDPPGVRP